MVRQVQGARPLAGEALELGGIGREAGAAVVEHGASPGPVDRLDLGPVVIGRGEDLVAGAYRQRAQPVQEAVAGAGEEPAAVLAEREREAAAAAADPHPRIERRERHQDGLAHRTRASARLASGRP